MGDALRVASPALPESFGEGWATDAVKQLKLDPKVTRADYGELPDLAQVDWSTDVLFTWNGTTSGVRVPDGEWIAGDREGLSFADATSAVFAYDLPWAKLDVVTFSWQKVLGGEGGHGVLILGPRAVERLENYTPPRPLPKLFRLLSGGKLNEGIFKGETINTPSMLALEDAIWALEWAKALGEGGLIARTNANAAALDALVAARLARPSRRRSGEPLEDQHRHRRGADESADQDVASLLERGRPTTRLYRGRAARASIWCGATIDDISSRSGRGSTGRTLKPGRVMPGADSRSDGSQGGRSVSRERVEIGEAGNPDELKAIILVMRARVRSATGVNAGCWRPPPTQGDRPRRHRCDNVTFPPPPRADHAPPRQFDHHRRTCGGVDIRARPRAARRRHFGPGRQMEKNRFAGVR